jgi:hypothetical protein
MLKWIGDAALDLLTDDIGFDLERDAEILGARVETVELPEGVEFKEPQNPLKEIYLYDGPTKVGCHLVFNLDLRHVTIVFEVEGEYLKIKRVSGPSGKIFIEPDGEETGRVDVPMLSLNLNPLLTILARPVQKAIYLVFERVDGNIILQVDSMSRINAYVVNRPNHPG